MDKKLPETQGATNLCVETMNSRREDKGKLGHVVQIRVNVILYLSIVLQSTVFLSLMVIFWSNCFPKKTNYI